MHDVLHKIIDALADLKAFSHNETAELHAALGQHQAQAPAAEAQDEPAHDAAGA